MQFCKFKLEKDHRELLEIIDVYKTIMRSNRSDIGQLKRNLEHHSLRLSELETELGSIRCQTGFLFEVEMFERENHHAA